MPVRRSFTWCYFNHRIQTLTLCCILIMNLFGVGLLLALLVIHKAQTSFDFNPSIGPRMMILSTLPQSRVSRYDVTLEALEQIEKARAEILAQLPQAIWASQHFQPCAALPFPFPQPFSSTTPAVSTSSESENLNNVEDEIESDATTVTESFPSPPFIDNETKNVVSDPYSPEFSGWEPPVEVEIKKFHIAPPSIRPDENFTSNDYESDATEPTKEIQRDIIEEFAEFLSNEITITKPVTLISSETVSPFTFSEPTTPPLPSSTTSKEEKIFLEINCSIEKDEHSSDRCKTWANAGYCERHPATKYIFCRLQCLCRHAIH